MPGTEIIYVHRRIFFLDTLGMKDALRQQVDKCSLGGSNRRLDFQLCSCSVFLLKFRYRLSLKERMALQKTKIVIYFELLQLVLIFC